MTMTPRKACVDHQVQWPEPVQCEYHEDISPATIKEIKKLANAPQEDDPNWIVVDGPGW